MRFTPLIAALTAACTLASPNLTAGAGWPDMVKQLSKSVVPIALDDRGTSCTGFVIGAGVVLTANHCYAELMVVDRTEAKPIMRSPEFDLMVLAVANTGRPALKLAKTDPNVGDVVASYGYGYGLDEPLFRIAHISAMTNLQGESLMVFLIDATFVPGQSGGPVVNTKGEIVMIVQRGTDRVGLGVGVATLKAKVGKYWAAAQ